MFQILHADGEASLNGTGEGQETSFGNTTTLTSFLYDFNGIFLRKSDTNSSMVVFIAIVLNGRTVAR
jgi:hypothetical protein